MSTKDVHDSVRGQALLHLRIADMKTAKLEKRSAMVSVVVVVLLAASHFIYGIANDSAMFVAGAVAVGSVSLGASLGWYSNASQKYEDARKSVEKIAGL